MHAKKLTLCPSTADPCFPPGRRHYLGKGEASPPRGILPLRNKAHLDILNPPHPLLCRFPHPTACMRPIYSSPRWTIGVLWAFSIAPGLSHKPGGQLASGQEYQQPHHRELHPPRTRRRCLLPVPQHHSPVPTSRGYSLGRARRNDPASSTSAIL